MKRFYNHAIMAICIELHPNVRRLRDTHIHRYVRMEYPFHEEDVMAESRTFDTAVGNDNRVSARYSFQPAFVEYPPHLTMCLPMHVADGDIIVSGKSFLNRSMVATDIAMCNAAFDLIVAKGGIR